MKIEKSTIRLFYNQNVSLRQHNDEKRPKSLKQKVSLYTHIGGNIFEKKSIPHKLHKMMIQEIEAALKIGKTDNDLPAYSLDEMTQFIDANQVKILEAIHDMIEEEEDVHDLKYPARDWIREFLYDRVTIL